MRIDTGIIGSPNKVQHKHREKEKRKERSPLHNNKGSTIMMPIFEDPAITDPKLIKNHDIPSHSPKIKNKQANTSKHREHIFHRIYPTIHLDYLY